MKTQHDTKESLSLYDNYKIGLKAKDTELMQLNSLKTLTLKLLRKRMKRSI